MNEKNEKKKRERFKMERERERDRERERSERINAREREERANVLVVVVIIIIIIARTSSCRSSGFTSIREGRRLSMYEKLFPFLRVCAFDAKKKVKKRENKRKRGIIVSKKTRAEARGAR